MMFWFCGFVFFSFFFNFLLVVILFFFFFFLVYSVYKICWMIFIFQKVISDFGCETFFVSDFSSCFPSLATCFFSSPFFASVDSSFNESFASSFFPPFVSSFFGSLD